MAPRSSRRNLINVAVFITLEVASLCMLSAGSVMRQMWIGRVFNTSMANMWKRGENIRSYFALRAINNELSQENFMLQEKLLAQNEEMASNVAPWKKTRIRYRIAPANVVTKTTHSQHNYLILDRGRIDGVQIDDGVITNNGVVGIVQGVSENFCYVLSYMSESIVVSTKVGHNGSIGSMSWTGTGTNKSVMTGIPLHEAVEIGDTVFTSGHSAIFPADIPLGRVTEKKTSKGSTAELSIKLFEDFSKLRYVTIVQSLDKQEIKALINEGN